MILAYHLVWTAYGWWFPNDPRGSWSRDTWNPRLAALPARRKKPLGREPVQPTPVELRQWLGVAQKRLKYPPVVLGYEARNIARSAIMTQVQLHDYVLPALAVMPEHVHVVVQRHDHLYERIVQAFKSVSSRALRKHFRLAALPARRDKKIRAAGSTAKREGTAAGATEQLKTVPVWSKGYWVRYLDNQKAVAQATAYVRRQT